MTGRAQISVIASLFALGAAAAEPSPSPGPTSTLPVVVGIQGAKTAELVFEGARRRGAVGTELRLGESVKTSAGVTVTVRYPDGSVVDVAPGSELRFKGEGGGVRAHTLFNGALRGQVTPQKDAPQKDAQARPRFIVRTKSATMGVRGTDFVFSFNAKTAVSQLNTLEGLVDFAKSDSQLLSGQATQVGAGNFTQSLPDASSISPPKPFDRTEFLSKFQSSPQSLVESLGAPGGSVPGGLPGAAAPGGVAIPGVPSGVSLPSVPSLPSAPTEAPEIRFDPPKAPDPSKQPPPPPPPKKKDEEEDKPKPRKPVLQIGKIMGAAYAGEGIMTDSLRTAGTLAWVPTINLPGVPLFLRGHAGMVFGARDATDTEYRIREVGVAAGLTLFDAILIEVGMGSHATEFSFADPDTVPANQRRDFTVESELHWGRVGWDLSAAAGQSKFLDQVFFMVSESKYPSGSLPFPSTLGRFDSRMRMQLRAGVVLSLF